MFCSHCGKEIGEDQAFCQHCGASLREPTSAPDAAESRRKTPWEDRETNGFFGGLFGTLKAVLFSPREFFRAMPVTGGLADPLLFALIVGMTGFMFSTVWQTIFKGTFEGYLPSTLRSSYQSFEGGGMVVYALLSPFFLIIALFIGAGMLHLFLLMLKGARAGFEATFRVLAYSFATNAILAVPFCGGIIAWIWSLVVIIIGLKEAHETTGGKAAVAVLFPLFLCCGVVIMFMVLFMGALFASFGMMQQQ